MDWPMLYFAIISTTGWTYEYVDDLEMRRAVEFMDCMARRPQQHLKMNDGKPDEDFSNLPLTEKEAMEQFDMAKTFIPVGGEIPQRLREMIAWAEEEKATMGPK